MKPEKSGISGPKSNFRFGKSSGHVKTKSSPKVANLSYNQALRFELAMLKFYMRPRVANLPGRIGWGIMTVRATVQGVGDI